MTIPELGGAKIAITPCPGKRQRDLELDLDQIKSWGAQAVVTLIESYELEMLSVGDMKSQVEQRSMRWFHCPIPDFSGVRLSLLGPRAVLAPRSGGSCAPAAASWCTAAGASVVRERSRRACWLSLASWAPRRHFTVCAACVLGLWRPV
eukprot:CAMPEP_0179098966 /NCGR_PEP_ID=MMETSP0796-20121207/45634_1 /TAXON_ID=73915 /ORGANISM="Pyrodinium bahamense, Strain pbaha01" /LENGTH=148 /DNA_ID=CAMNT_0020796757 /DNA_START=162 /DNA_END=605 /DNA_ORIENTATION=-